MRRGGEGKLGARDRLAAWAVRARLWLAVFALLSQSFALASPEMRPADARGAAAQLTAALGVSVVVCVQDDGSGVPAPASDCHDQCPLCRLAASLDNLDVPSPAGLAAPVRLSGAAFAVPHRQSVAAAAFLGFSLARGPPSPT